MQTLAGILLERKSDAVKVSGSDLEKSERTRKLQAMGAEIYYGHRASNLPKECDLVVYSSAVTCDNVEYAEAIRRDIPLIRRGEFLAELAKNYKKTVIVSGSHGKTSTCATLVHLLKKQNIDCGYLIGGELVHGNSFSAGDGEIFVTEADESDGTHVFFEPYINIVTNLDDDHSWSVGGEDKLKQNFLASAAKSHKLIYWQNEVKDDIFNGLPNVVEAKQELLQSTKFPLNIVGYQKKNSLLALMAMQLLSLPVKVDDLSDFVNVKRRMTTICEKDNFIVIEDYAHHPKELKSALDLLREKYPNYNLTVIFQIHRAARMTKYFSDFAEILSQNADEVILSRIFEAWVSDTSDYSPKILAEKIPNGKYIEDFSEIVKQVKAITMRSSKQLIAVIGAGDIHKIIGDLEL